MSKKVILQITLTLLLLGLIFCPSKNIEAKVLAQNGKIFSIDNLNSVQLFSLFEANFLNGASICSGDINGDGQAEIVVGAGQGRPGEIKVYNSNGKLIQSGLYPFSASFQGGIDVACADLNSDQKDEVIVAVASNDSSHLKIYQLDTKKVIADFYSEPKVFQGGVHIAAGDIDNDHQVEILVSRGQGTRSEIKVFKADGTRKNFILYPFDQEFKGGVDVAIGDVDGDNQKEIITSAARQGKSHIKIYSASGKLKSQFFAFGQSFSGGVNIASFDVNQDGKAEILAGAGPGGGPQVRVFNAKGEIQNNLNFFPYEKTWKGGVNIAVLIQNNLIKIITVPGLNSNNNLKKIVVDISSQRLRAYEGTKVVLDAQISSGKPGMDTPLGAFKILNKSVRAWSSKYKLYMPYWMEFNARGYGLHELPEWPGGYKEGANHLGVRVSHGCVRLGVGYAQKLFNWAGVGTPVIVQD